MKYFFSIILLVVFSAAIAQKAKSKSRSDITDEISKVKATIERETRAFFEIDHKTWSDCWAQTPYAYWSFADTTDVNFFNGWTEINNGFSIYFRTAKRTEAKITRDWQEVRVNGNLAYARFTQKVRDNIERDSQSEVRVLEKIDGVWKIVHVGVIARQKRRN